MATSATLQNPSAGNLSLYNKKNTVSKSGPGFCSFAKCRNKKKRVVAAVGDLSADSTNYLIAGALGTAFPIIFSRKDTCPECDGAGFVRKGRLRANAARKDQAQIVTALASSIKLTNNHVLRISCMRQLNSVLCL